MDRTPLVLRPRFQQTLLARTWSFQYWQVALKKMMYHCMGLDWTAELTLVP
jgi:hypothetical protein